jgi:hypothetical protein
MREMVREACVSRDSISQIVVYVSRGEICCIAEKVVYISKRGI